MIRNYRSISLVSENGVEFEVVPGGGGGYRLRGRGGAVAPVQRFSEEQDWYAVRRAACGVCCAAAQSLDKAAKDYRKMLCQCLKDIAISFPINVVKTRQLPKICVFQTTSNLIPMLNANLNHSFN